MKMDSMRDLLLDQLADLYSAESQLLKALPKAIKSASSMQLKDALSAHLAETAEQKKRLEEAFSMLREKPKSEKCEGMAGLIREVDKTLKSKGNETVKDAGIIAGAQRVEHYEISGYGTAVEYARILGREDVAMLLQKTLEEEYGADKLLNGIAKEGINQRALSAA